MRIFVFSLALIAGLLQTPASATPADWKLGPSVTGVDFSMSAPQARKSFEAELGPLDWKRMQTASENLHGTNIVFRHGWFAESNGRVMVRYFTDLKGRLIQISRTEEVAGDSAEQVVRPAEKAYGEPFRQNKAHGSYEMMFGMTTQGSRLTDSSRGWDTCNTDKLWENKLPLADCQWAIHVNAFPIASKPGLIQRNISFYHAQRSSEAYDDAQRRAKRGNF